MAPPSEVGSVNVVSSKGEPTPSSLPTDLLREAMSYRTAGLAVVTTRGPDGTDMALTASTFASVSLEPPLAVIGLRRAGQFHDALLARSTWAVTLLADGQHPVAAAFGRPRAEHHPEDLRRWSTRRMPGGSLAFVDGLVAVECTLTASMEAGTATVVVGRVTAAVRGTGEDPLLYFRRQYRRISGEPVRLWRR